MQRINNIILKATMAILAVVLAAGCVFEKENPTASREYRNVLVQLGISTDPMTQTKADAAQIGKQTPTPDEKLVSSLRVYAYIGGALCGYLEDLDGVSEGEALLMDLRLPTSGNVTVDFVAIANEEKMSGTGDQISVSVERNDQGTLTFSRNIGMDEFKKIVYTLADQDFAKVGIPMYATGSKTINTNKVEKQNDAQGHEGHFLLKDILNITLTRSLAKVAVYAAEEGPAAKEGETETYNVKINSVKISNVIASGNLFPGQTLPKGYAAEQTMSSTEVAVNSKLDKSSETFSSDRVDPDKFTLVTATPYYIPENGAGNIGDAYKWNEEVTGATKLTVNYSTGNGTPKDEVIYLPKIERNKFYNVLCLIKANGQMTFEFVVVDWQTGTGKYVDFKDDVTLDTSHGLQWNGVKIADVEGKEEKYTLGVTAGSSVTCTFKITAPADGMWYASLTEGDVQNYVFENGQSTISGYIRDNEHSFTLRTLNSNLNSGSSKSVKLVITAVNSNGRSMVVNFNKEGYYIVEQAQM